MLNKPLPPNLASFQEMLESTKRPCVAIELSKNEKLLLWNSKVGGYPYLHKASPYPTDAEGNYLFFLAQINFAEMPPLPDFPRQGILQFYISDNDLFGLSFSNPRLQNTFRVIFIENPSNEEQNLCKDFSFLPSFNRLPLSAGICCEMQFAAEEMWVSGTDNAFFKGIANTELYKQLSEGQIEELNNICEASGHRVGGYPFFTQDDPRSEEENVLLLQLDTDQAVNMMWGDMGVCNFFIEPENLRKRDFSNVRYNWDCY